MTEREKVLALKSLIETISPLLQAHIAKVNSDPNGLGNNFEDCATHLMIADPVVVKKSKANKRVNVSAFGGWGPKTVVEYRFHDNEEFKKLTRAQKKELFEYRKTVQGKAAFEASRNEFKKRKAGDISNDKKKGKAEKKKQKRFDKKVQ